MTFKPKQKHKDKKRKKSPELVEMEAKYLHRAYEEHSENFFRDQEDEFGDVEIMLRQEFAET